MVAKRTKRTPETFTISAGVNPTAAILTFASLYSGSILDVINELVQNQIDAEATKGEIRLDLSRNRMVTLDDGNGTTIAAMVKRLGNIGTRHTTDETKIGEKNLGNLAPLGVAMKYSFMTRPRKEDPNHPFFTISFDRANIEGREEPVFECVKHARGEKGSFSREGWTTSMTVGKIEGTALRKIRREKDPLDVICSSIASAFRSKIKETGIEVKVSIILDGKVSRSRIVTPLEYPGRRKFIEIPTAHEKGNVSFEMFLTTKPQRSPQLLVDHRGVWQFPLKNLDIWSAVSSVFDSGYIQGTIRVDFCELLKNRKGFEWSEELELLNDAILSFVIHHAGGWVEKLKQEKDLDKFEDVARNVLASIMDSRILEEFPDLLDHVFRGSISTGHTGVDVGDDVTRVNTHRRGPKSADSKPRRKKGEERNQLHNGVSSTTGTRRRSVKGQNGLQIINGDWVGNRAKLGTEGEEAGRIVINVMHSDYISAANKGGLATLNNYVGHLVYGLLSASLSATPELGDLFWREYEETFMGLFTLIPPIVASKRRTNGG
jgi:hypothetical protein